MKNEYTLIIDNSNDTIKSLFDAMRNDFAVMSEHGDSEESLAKELVNADEEILAEYAAVFLG